jgi:hypothetical protein
MFALPKTKHVLLKSRSRVVFLRVYYSADLGSFTTRLQILLLKYKTSPLKSQQTHDTHQPMEYDRNDTMRLPNFYPWSVEPSLGGMSY